MVCACILYQAAAKRPQYSANGRGQRAGFSKCQPSKRIKKAPANGRGFRILAIGLLSAAGEGTAQTQYHGQQNIQNKENRHNHQIGFAEVGFVGVGFTAKTPHKQHH